MKGELYQSDLDFIEECKKVFENDYRRFININADGDRIALRYGMDHNCVKLFELGEEKAFFHNIMEKCPVETVKVDSEDKRNLYVIDYTYLDDIGEVDKDRWTVVGKGVDHIRKLMEENSKAFKASGLKMLDYKLTSIPNEIDGYEIIIRKKNDY